METQAQYEQREIKRALKRFDENERATKQERKEARIEFACVPVDWLQTQIEWMLNGSYGMGEMLLAKQAVEHGKLSKRFNRNARLFIMVANYNWLCPSNDARKVWKGCDQSRRDAVTQAINQAVIESENTE